MKTQHVPSSLRRSTSALEQLLLSLLLMPQLLVAAPGCTGIVDEAGNDEADAPSAASIFVYDPSKEGMVQSAMAAAGARFVTDGYETVIVNVDGSNTARLAPIVTQFLDAGKQVVLDSNGGPTERIAIGELAGATAGIAAQETALSIVQNAPGAFTVTPIADKGLEAAFGADVSGNTPLAVLQGSSAPQDVADLSAEGVASFAGAGAAATDTITKYHFQGNGQPAPAIVPSYVDNQATHIQTGSSGSSLKRYLYRGNPQECPTEGSNNCVMTWGEQYTKSIAHGTSISVKLDNKLTEKLTGGVTLGYSLTVTTARTLSWSNAVNIQPGWTARPVSFLWRKSGYGQVKNAYVFQSRVKRAAACRPTGGCFGVYDTYVRQPSTSVGTWSANVALNQGAPTNSWNTFRGAADPNSYTFD